MKEPNELTRKLHGDGILLLPHQARLRHEASSPKLQGGVQALTPTSQRVQTPWMAASPVSPAVVAASPVSPMRE